MIHPNVQCTLLNLQTVTFLIAVDAICLRLIMGMTRGIPSLQFQSINQFNKSVGVISIGLCIMIDWTKVRLNGEYRGGQGGKSLPLDL